jgi:bacterioferritin (cytochrome b1)
MLDLDFYLNPKPLLKKQTFYSYSTGYFLPLLYQKIKEIKPCVEKINLQHFLSEVKKNSLFGSRCFWVDISSEQDYSDIVKAVTFLSEDDRLFVTAHKENIKSNVKEIFKSEITEVEKNKAGFKPLLQMILLNTQTKPSFTEENIFFEKNMEEFYSKCETILDFIQGVEYYLFSCVENGKFDSSLFRSLLPLSEPKRYFMLHEHIYFLLTTPSAGG